MNELSCSVLRDPGDRIGVQLGIVTAATDGVRPTQAQPGLTAATVGDRTDTMRVPTVVVAGLAGAIRWTDGHPNRTTRSEPRQISDARALSGR